MWGAELAIAPKPQSGLRGQPQNAKPCVGVEESGLLGLTIWQRHERPVGVFDANATDLINRLVSSCRWLSSLFVLLKYGFSVRV